MLATKQDLQEMEKRIMSVISDFAAKQQQYNQAEQARIEAMSTTLGAIQGDIQNLNDQIAALQNSAGEVTPEDQALLDALDAQGAALAAKAEVFKQALDALDAAVPPVPPIA